MAKQIMENIPFLITTGIAYIVIMVLISLLKVTRKILGLLSFVIGIAMIMLVVYKDQVVSWIMQIIR